MTLPEYYAQADERLATIFADYPYGKFEFRSPKYFESLRHLDPRPGSRHAG